MGAFSQYIPFVLICLVFYFVVYYPMTKQDRERRTRLEALKVGDEVVLNGGILGKVHALGNDGIVELEISNRSRIRVIRKEINDLYSAYKSKQDDGGSKSAASSAKAESSGKDKPNKDKAVQSAGSPGASS